MSPAPRLRPLGSGLPGAGRSREDEILIKRAWPRIVGPALAARSRPLAARQGTLVLGCWDPALLSGLRGSAETSWPRLQERIARLLGISLHAMRVEPCDPPETAGSAPRELDPLDEVLRRFRAQVKQGLAPRLG